jgi:hypothetical protein
MAVNSFTIEPPYGTRFALVAPANMGMMGARTAIQFQFEAGQEEAMIEWLEGVVSTLRHSLLDLNLQPTPQPQALQPAPQPVQRPLPPPPVTRSPAQQALEARVSFAQVPPPIVQPMPVAAVASAPAAPPLALNKGRMQLQPRLTLDQAVRAVVHGGVHFHGGFKYDPVTGMAEYEVQAEASPPAAPPPEPVAEVIAEPVDAPNGAYQS